MDIQIKTTLIPIYLLSRVKKVFPWISLTLLACAYIILGLFLAEIFRIWMGWVLAFIGVLFVAMIFTFPKLNIERQLSRWLRSDTSALILLILFAALVSVILLWLHIFLKLIAIIAAETLFRLELYRNGFSATESFWLLSMTSMIGLTLGWGVAYFIG